MTLRVAMRGCATTLLLEHAAVTTLARDVMYDDVLLGRGEERGIMLPSHSRHRSKLQHSPSTVCDTQQFTVASWQQRQRWALRHWQRCPGWAGWPARARAAAASSVVPKTDQLSFWNLSVLFRLQSKLQGRDTANPDIRMH